MTHPDIPKGAKLPTWETLEDLMQRRTFGTEDPGWCVYCGGESSGHEPDARGQECQCCGQPGAWGPEELLLRGAYTEEEENHHAKA